ncbi:hypothetical protein ACIRPX_00660 [Streptomyces sp. NPDC101225]|uniref:hypothetical protein n=1 Tax=Streptomyces sp. NPDC101225 TaxID=3366135 RepID=UPI00381CB3F8
MSSTTDEIPAAVLDILAPPAPDELSGDQVRGRACVWCGVPLNAETSVALGARVARGDGAAPAAGGCRRCVAARAHRGLFSHGSACELCADEESAKACAVGRGLYRLVRKHRR